MYSLKVEGSFSSAHNLRGYKGKCEDLHGHNWRIEVGVNSEKLDKIGMVLDFKFIKHELNVILEKLDHKYLNEITYFRKVNPTSENIACFIYQQLKKSIKLLEFVTVWENSTACATYSFAKRRANYCPPTYSEGAG